MARRRGRIRNAMSRVAARIRRASPVRTPTVVVAAAPAPAAPRRRFSRIRRAATIVRAKVTNTRSTMGIDIKQVAKDVVMSSAGGIASAGAKGLAKLTDTTIDDSPVFQVAAQTAVGVVLGVLFGRQRAAHSFISGWQGAAAAAAVADFVEGKTK